MNDLSVDTMPITRRALRADRRKFKKAVRRSNTIARSARREIIKISRQDELPAGRVARAGHRANEVAAVVTTVVTIFEGAVAIRDGYRRLRATPATTSVDSAPVIPE